MVMKPGAPDGGDGVTVQEGAAGPGRELPSVHQRVVDEGRGRDSCVDGDVAVSAWAGSATSPPSMRA